jgi:hypothetical protein
MYFLNLIILINTKVNEIGLKQKIRIYKHLKLIVGIMKVKGKGIIQILSYASSLGSSPIV